MIGSLDVGKKILLHIGPPKTGSSAIQKCFLDNASILLENGIFYPSHATDNNGISSGHQHVILSENVAGELVIDRKKIGLLIEEFNESQAHIMVLSSEAFFRRAHTLIRIVPNCEAIAFIRSPIDFIESIYNQSVKRHMNNAKIQLPAYISTSHLTALATLIDNNKTKNIRLFAYKRGQDVVETFKKALSVDVNLEMPKNSINSSYSHEALQFKRIVNSFQLGDLDNEIDNALQAYSKGSRDYTYIEPSKYQAYQAECYNALAAFCDRYFVVDSENLFDELKHPQPYEVKRQDLSLSEVTKIINYLNRNHRKLYFQLSSRLSTRECLNEEAELVKKALVRKKSWYRRLFRKE